MLDLALYDRVHISARPPAQRLLAELFLRFDYRKVDLVVEGLENLPNRPVIFAMNHTDNYNYWPFQYSLHKHGTYMATWVKGKNYENSAISTFMQWTNNIPIASRGYVITRDFLNVMGRRPAPDEYRALRDATDNLGEIDCAAVPRTILTEGRDILGHRFDPKGERYVEAIDAVMKKLMGRFVELNERALALGSNLLVFPEGTRSIRLSRGHTGLAQMALHLNAPIVPVGCNGSDLVYTSRSVLTKPGRIVYRIGEAMSDWSELAPKEPFVPFTREAETKHRGAFQAIVDRVMERINDLVDERHKSQADRASDGSSGTDRFM
ncbi:MAG: 1-acyl-sn-glycerol-3-phosphate acyltransferase [Deltaproteobacteria bacterium]|nr:1-acyl-sn-glycerol-3-phosphate acyltransferase [Deltaproteobacteria bacterium]